MEALRVLGRLAVVDSNGPRTLGGPKQQAVLGLLVAQHGLPVPVGRLIDEVWGDDSPPSAKVSIHSYISNLRKNLSGISDIVRSGDSYRVVLRDPASLDVEVAVRLVRAAEEAAEGGHATEAKSLYLQALERFGSAEPYEGIDMPTVNIERERLEELRASCLERSFELRLNDEEPSRIVPELVASAASEPLRERRTELLMLALYRTGRQADALSAFQSLRQRLSTQLGLEPSKALADLEHAILKQDPALLELGHGYENAAAPSPTGSPTTIIGRSAELSELRGSAKSARNQAGAVALVVGEAGSGKTTLVDALVDELSDFTCVYGRCEPNGSPLQAVRQIAVQLLESLGDSSEVHRLRAPLAPLVAPDSSTGEFDLPLDGAAVVAVIERLLVATSANRPVAIVLEDLHWAGHGTTGVFTTLASRLRDLSVLMIGTYREEDIVSEPLATTDIAEISRDTRLTVCRLQPMTTLDIEQMSHQARPELSLPQRKRLAMALHRATGGNPYFIMELIRSFFTEAENLTLGHQRAKLGIPEAVRHVVRSRLSRLSPATRETLQLVALLGVQFSLSDVRTVGGERAVRNLVSAENAGVLDQADAGLLRFRHEITQRIVYEEIGSILRAELHLRIATALRETPLGKGRAAELARHLAGASGLVNDADIATALIDASVASTSTGAFKEAIELANRAIAAAETAGSVNIRLEAGIVLGEALRAHGDPGYRDVLVRAAELALDSDQIQLTEQALLVLASEGASLTIGSIDTELMVLIDRLIAQMEEWRLPVRPELRAARASLFQFTLRCVEREVLYAEALQLARDLGDQESIARVLQFANFTIDAPQQLERRRECERLLRDIAQSKRDRYLLFEADRLAFSIAVQRLDRPTMDATHERMASTARFFQRAPMLWAVSYQSVIRLTLSGKLEDAELEAAHCLELCKATGAQEPRWLSIYATHLFVLRETQGRLAELAPYAEQMAERWGHLPAWNAPYAAVSLAAGNPTIARDLLARIVTESGDVLLHEDLAFACGIYTVSPVACALGNRRQVDALTESLRQCGVSVAWAGSTVFGLNSLALAELALARSDFRLAADLALQAVEDAVALDAPTFEVGGRALAKLLLSRLGDEKEARRQHELGDKLALDIGIPFATRLLPTNVAQLLN